jgi:hypothetical protein
MRACAGLLAVCIFMFAGCGKPVDLTTGLRVQNVSTGWFDAGIVDGQNKLVPSISLTLKNLSDQNLVVLRVRWSFRRVTEKDEWTGGEILVAGSQGLAPGATSAPLIIRSQKGYTGSDETREEMLRNSHFVDAEVEVSAKYGSVQWKRIGEYPVTRRLITTMKSPS